MKIISAWNAAPSAVKLISLLWMVLGIAGIVSGLYSLQMFLRLPVQGLTEIVVVEIGLQVCIAAFVSIAACELLLRAAWSRVVLEIISWLTLAYYTAAGVPWVGLAIFRWDHFKVSAATQLPRIGPVLKLIAGSSLYVVFAAISVIVIRGLRSSVVRNYVGRMHAGRS